jgi:hypothetical protein
LEHLKISQIRNIVNQTDLEVLQTHEEDFNNRFKLEMTGGNMLVDDEEEEED